MTDPIVAQIPIVLAFIIGGLIWTTSGYFADWRKNKGKPDYKGFQVNKLKDDVILGTILGVVAFFFNAYDGGTVVAIDSIATFSTAIVGAFGVVGIVDKFIVKGIFNK